jgi:uncharacterized membrane protein
VNEWVHGPLWAGSVIRENGTVVISCAHLPAGTYLEIRALYPPGAFPLAEAGSGTVRPGIMEEEARWAEEANLRRQDEARQRAEHDRRVEKGKWFVIGGCLIGFGLWTWIFTAFRHRPRVPRIPRLTSEIPAETPPALLDYLLNSRRVSTGGLVGTMLDLCRRGFVRLREERVQKKRIFGGTRLESDYYWDLDRKHLSEAAELADFERDLLTFMFDEVAQGADSISLEALKKARRKFAAFFRGWTKLVQADAERMQWFDKRSIGGFYRSLALGVAMIALGVPAGIYLDVWAVLPMVTGAVIVALSFMIPQRTEAGQALALKWKAVQKYLKKYEFRSADRSDLLANISNYLVYGVVLGLSTRIYEELAAYMPEGRQRTFVPWYVYPTGGRGGFSPAAFGQAFSAMVATTTSSMSTAAGTGGGASGGGGGGAGSGGGGAG